MMWARWIVVVTIDGWSIVMEERGFAPSLNKQADGQTLWNALGL